MFLLKGAIELELDIALYSQNWPKRTELDRMLTKVSHNVNIWWFYCLSNKVNLWRLSLSQTLHEQDFEFLWTTRLCLSSVLLSLLYTYPLQLLRDYFLEVLRGHHKRGLWEKSTRVLGKQAGEVLSSLPTPQPGKLHFDLFDINFCLRGELCCLFCLMTEKDKEEKWTLKMTHLAACEVTCAFSLPQQAFQDEVELLNVALEIWPRGLAFELSLVPTINEYFLTHFLETCDTGR